MDKSIYHKNYLPVIKQFAEETKGTFERGYHEGVFIPYVFDGYWDSSFKVFYIGQDTAYWLTNELEPPFYYGNELFIENRDNNTLDKYLDLNSSCVTAERLVTGSMSRNCGVFWNFIQKLHIRLCTGEFKAPLSSLSVDERMLIRNIGYGEINCIELPGSLEKEYNNKEECWEDNDWESYLSVAKAAEKLADFQLLLDTFSPDLIIITSGCDELVQLEKFKSEMVVDFQNDMYSAFRINGYATKFIWTYHPRVLRSWYGDEKAINDIASQYEMWGCIE